MHCVAIPPDVKPAIRPALGVLAETLTDRHYSAHTASRILAYVVSEGTLAGAPGLEPDDEDAAEFAFVSALEPVPFDSPDWGSLEDLEDIDAIINRAERAPLGPRSIPAPIRGGAPDDQPADDFPRIKSDADRRQDQADVREFYRDNPEPPNAA